MGACVARRITAVKRAGHVNSQVIDAIAAFVLPSQNPGSLRESGRAFDAALNALPLGACCAGAKVEAVKGVIAHRI